MVKLTRLFLLLSFVVYCYQVDAQKDTSDMKLDIGWTRDKDINLWPFLKYKKDTVAGTVKTDVLFSICGYERDRGFQEKSSHFYPLWRRNRNINESDFRLFSIYYPSVFHYNYDKTKQIKSFDFLELAPKISFLGLSKSSDGLYVDNSLLFLLWYNKNEIDKSSYLIFFPLYWSFKNPNHNTHTFFPLWSSGTYHSNQSKYFVATPLFWHFKTANKSSSVLFPLIYSQKNEYRKSFTFLPVFTNIKSTNGNQFTAVTPLYWHIKYNLVRYNILFPIIWNFKLQDSSSFWRTDIIFPIWFSHSDENVRKRILFPVIWSYKDSLRSSFTLFPIYSHRKNKEGNSSMTMVSLLFYHTQSYDEKTTVLFPLWFSIKDENRQLSVLMPFVFNQKNKRYHSLTVLPLFSYGSDTSGTNRHFAVTPIFWHFKESDKVMNTLFPIFWDIKYHSENNPEHRTILFPLFFKYHDNEHNRLTIFPILYSFHNPYYHSFTFLPLFSYGKANDSSSSHFSVATLFWNFKSPKDTMNVLFPIWWNRHRMKNGEECRSNVLFPLYWSFTNPEKKNRVLFPVLWSLKDPYYKSFTLIPFFSYGHSNSGYQKYIAVTPLFWHLKNGYENSTILFPLIWVQKNKSMNLQGRSIVFPLWWSRTDSLKSHHVFFPIVWSYRNTDYKSTTIFPLFSFGRSADGKIRHSVVTPLFWHFKDQESHKTVLFPLFDYTASVNGDKNFGILFFLYRYKSADSLKRADFIWPICQYKSDNNVKSFRLAPVIWYKKTPESKFFSIQPFYYHHITAEYSDYHIFWQLFTYKNIKGKEKSWNFLWKTFYFEKYQPQGHEFRFLYLFFADVKKEGKVEKSFFPFYYFSKEDNGNRSLSLFLYFYNSFRRQLPNSAEFYKEERIFWFIRLRSNYRRLKAEGKL